MLKAVVGAPDSNGVVIAKIQSGPTLPDIFIPPNLTSSPKTMEQTITPECVLKHSPNFKDSSIFKKRSIEKYLMDHENPRYDTKRHILHNKRLSSHNAIAQTNLFNKRLAELRQTWAELMQGLPV